MIVPPYIWAIFTFSALVPGAHAFSFTTTSPTQCDDLTVSWTGGTPPFQLLLAPLFGSPRNVSVPSASFNNGKGSLPVQVPFAATQKFVITMSDATGFATGGSTDLLTVGPSQGGNCVTTDPGVDFSFQLNSALQQCRPYIFSDYTGAIQPVTIIGTIPGGTTFILTPPAGPTTFTWTANVGAGTSILFTMFDSRGRNGGTSDVKTVGITNDASCLDNTSPSSTPAPVPSPTPTSSHISATTKSRTPVETSPLPSVSPESGSKTSVAAIAGTVIGALVFLAVAVTLGLFYLRKRKDSNQRRPRTELDPYNAPDTPGNYPYSSGAVAATSASPMALMPGAGYDSNPFLDNPPGHSPHHQTDYAHPPPSPYQPPSHYQAPYQETPQYPQYPSSQSQYSNISHQRSPTSDPDPFNPYSLAHEPPPAIIEPFDLTERSSARDSMSTTQRKAAMAGMSTYTPSRFIIHTDVEDELPPPNQDGFVELPPQYSERRGPLMSAAASSSAANYPPSGS